METSNPKCGHSESGTVEAGGRAADEYPSGVQSWTSDPVSRAGWFPDIKIMKVPAFRQELGWYRGYSVPCPGTVFYFSC